MARDYDHLFKLLIIGDSGKFPSREDDAKLWAVSDSAAKLSSFRYFLV